MEKVELLNNEQMIQQTIYVAYVKNWNMRMTGSSGGCLDFW